MGEVERRALKGRVRSAWLVGGLALLLVLAGVAVWASARPRVAIPAGSLVAKDPCGNRIYGPYHLAGDQLSFTDLGIRGREDG